MSVASPIPHYADIHCHPSLKPYLSSHNPEKRVGMWKPLPISPVYDEVPRWMRPVIDDAVHGSQASYQQLQQGKVRVVFHSITPAEHQFYYLRRFMSIFLRRNQLARLHAAIINTSKEVMAQRVSGTLTDHDALYFDELEDEYNYVRTQVDASKGKRQIQLVGGYAELQEVLQKDDFTAATILNVEGAHSLFNFSHARDLKLPAKTVNNPNSVKFQQYESLLENNIKVVKRWGPDGRHTPFTMTFSHHFWNLLAGHAKSVGGVMGTLFVNQTQGCQTGFTELGRRMLRRLLARDNGRRILIDAKHLSVPSRLEFYKLLREEYWEKGDPVPVIQSHAAVNGHATMASSLATPDTMKKIKDQAFNTWSINVSDEELQLLHDCQGLFGIMFHDMRVPGGKPLKQIFELRKQIAKRDRDHRPLFDDLNRVYRDLTAANLLHIARVVGKKSAWDVPCIGSDYDGVMPAFHCYPDCAAIPNVLEDFRDFLLNPHDLPDYGFTKKDIKKLLFKLDPDEIAYKIGIGNVDTFLRRFFTDDYRLRGKTPVA